MLRQVSEIPNYPMKFKETFTARDIRAFLRSGMDVAEISYEDHTAHCTYNSAMRYLKSHGLQDRLDVVSRKEHVYLSRKPEAR